MVLRVTLTLTVAFANLVDSPGQPRKSDGEKDRNSHTEQTAVNTSNHVVIIPQFLYCQASD